MSAEVAEAPRRTGLLVAFVLMLVTYVALVYAPLSEFAIDAIQGILYLAVPIGALTAGLLALRKSPDAYRHYWISIVAALVLIVIAETYTTWYQVFVTSELVVPVSIGDAVFLVAYIPLLVYMVQLINARLGLTSRIMRLRFTIDALMMATISVFGVVALLFTQLRHQTGMTGGLAGYVNLAYVVLDVVVLVGIAVSIASPGRIAWRSWAAQTAIAMAVMAGADLLYWLAASGGYEVGNLGQALVDVVWMISYFLFAHAAGTFIAGRHAIDPEPELPVGLEERQRWFELIPTAAAVVFVPYFMWAARYRTTSDLGYWAFVDMATWLGVLVVARGVVLTVVNRQLTSASITDPLTRLYNHRLFHERLDIELSRARRTGESVSVAMIDLDDFRVVNDNLGHLAGDRRLRAIAEAIRRAARSSDTPCRVGGDEFALIMPATDSVEAFAVALRLSSGLTEVSRDEAGAPTTASVGIASFPKDAGDKEALLRAADTALYWAKDHGRDQAMIFDPEIGEADGPRDRMRRLEEESLLRTVRTLAAAVDARDACTHSHSRNVATFSVALARHIGLPEERVRRIEMAALLHDVGKIGIRDRVLTKKDDLDRFEFEMVREHPVLGEKILRSTAAQDILPWVLHHHERWDGNGYPAGLAGNSIPFEARIIALCDAYDAMRSDRPYREGISEAGALLELATTAGGQFDPELTRAFMEVVRSGEVGPPLEHRVEVE